MVRLLSVFPLLFKLASLILYTFPVAATDCKTSTVQSGSTCFSIATAAGINTTQLSSYNPGLDCSALQIGQVLCVSPGNIPGQPVPYANGTCAMYTTKSGDSCAAIATNFHITTAEIETWNANTFQWKGCVGLQVGFTMCVSTGTPPPVPVNPALECGPASPGNATCPLKACCSQFGYCGLTSGFCTSTGPNPCLSNCFTPALPSCASGRKIRKMGYYAGWANRRACTTFNPSQLDLTGYTHVHFAFATINQDYTIGIAGDDDPLLRELVSLKSIYSGLKVIVAVGGWAFSEDDPTRDLFSVTISSSPNRATFINSVKNFLSMYTLDGIDIDFEYPSAVERGAPATDTPNLTALFQEMRTALPDAVISAATPAGYWFLKGFEIDKIVQSVTYLNMMSYDYHGPWDTNVTDQAPVTNPHTSILDITASALLYTRAGIDLSMVNLGLAWYGRTYHLADSSCTGYNCTMTGGGAAGNCTQASGILAQFEVLSSLGSVQPTYDSSSETYWFNKNGDLITFDQATTWQDKTNFAESTCFGGTFAWSFDQVAPTESATTPTPTTTAPTSTTTYPAPTGCPTILTAAAAQATLLMDDYESTYCVEASKKDGGGFTCLDGFFVDSTDSQKPRLWTDLIAIETMYNYMWASGDTTWTGLIDDQHEAPNANPPSPRSFFPAPSDWVNMFSSLDDAGWAGLMYVKVHQYEAAHGNSSENYYVSLASNVHDLLSPNWFTTCGGGMPQHVGDTGINTITSELFFSLSAVLYLETNNQTYKTWAQEAADWFLTGSGKNIRDSNGLWQDSLNTATCSSGIGPAWSYNQGIIVSAFGDMFKITGDQKYKAAGVSTIDSIVNGGGSNSDMQVVNGIIKESSDDVSGCQINCNYGDQHDHDTFKGIFMKHLQYFLDAVNDNSISYKYASFIGAQASAIIHFATSSSGVASNCWYAPSQGGPDFDTKTKQAALDGLLCAAKYARC